MNKNKANINDRLIFKYLNGTATEKEIQLVENWVHANNKHKNYFEKFKLAFESANSYEQYRSINVNEEWEIFETMKNQSMKTKKQKLRSTWIKIAASILIIIGAGYTVYYLSRPKLITYEYSDLNPMVYLPDSSVVYMEAGTKITFIPPFTRNISFAGEAFFEIQPDPKNEFIINLKRSKIIVHGTSFNVKTNKQIEIELYEGQVQFLTQSDTANLKPGEKAIFIPNKEKLSIEQFKDTIPPLEFRNILLEDLTKVLEKRYLYKISVSSDIRYIRITGRFMPNTSIEDILELLSKSTGIKYTIENRHIHLKMDDYDDEIINFRF